MGPSLVQSKLCALHPCGATVCTSEEGDFPLTCTYENNIVYTHHVNDVHDGQLFMCYHNYVTEVCTCLCWKTEDLKNAGTEHMGVHRNYATSNAADAHHVQVGPLPRQDPGGEQRRSPGGEGR